MKATTTTVCFGWLLLLQLVASLTTTALPTTTTKGLRVRPHRGLQGNNDKNNNNDKDNNIDNDKNKNKEDEEQETSSPTIAPTIVAPPTSTAPTPSLDTTTTAPPTTTTTTTTAGNNNNANYTTTPTTNIPTATPTQTFWTVQLHIVPSVDATRLLAALDRFLFSHPKTLTPLPSTNNGVYNIRVSGDGTVVDALSDGYGLEAFLQRYFDNDALVLTQLVVDNTHIATSNSSSASSNNNNNKKHPILIVAFCVSLAAALCFVGGCLIYLPYRKQVARKQSQWEYNEEKELDVVPTAQEEEEEDEGTPAASSSPRPSHDEEEAAKGAEDPSPPPPQESKAVPSWEQLPAQCSQQQQELTS